jgi:ParB family transcriptional regulator, chromosome partitioning protein
MPLQLDDLDLLDAPQPLGGRPLLLPVDAIDEDPEQPRNEFDEEALRELAATIAQRGVRQPISVRPHPTEEGRWILNFGARRLRASRLAGKADIPAFVDETADSYDQVIENEQREALKPLELALFVRRRIAAGDSQADIARRLGKSRQYITFATALIDPPDWLLGAYRDGRCRGLTELYELRKLYAERPDRLEGLIAEQEPITRERIVALRADFRGERSPVSLLPVPRASAEVGASPVGGQGSGDPPPPTRERAHALQVELDGARFELIVNHAPPEEGRVFVRPVDGGPRRAVIASHLKLLGFTLR